VSDLSPRLTLRPLREADLPYFDSWARPDADQWSFFGFRAPEQVRRDFAATGLVSPEATTLLVEVDGVIVGDVGWHTVLYGPPPNAGHAPNIGIRLLKEHRSKGYGTAAQRMLADHLFATTQVNRVEASTDVENIAEQRSLEKAGFTREGVVRGAQFRAGAWHDLVAYSRLRADA
jgi:RimJ/RimL family protein N-acetyltransferase